jgi:putative nucleotidyltransferase with HDIG domain
MITRQEAYDLVIQNVKQKNLVKHILAVEAVMRRLAEHLEQDIEFWGLTGLLHDLDYSKTADKPEQHTYLTIEWLEKYNIPEDMKHAINAHPGHIPCESQLDWALYCADPVTGLIVAGVLMHPSKKLIGIDVSYMLRRFKEKRFAAGANRDDIAKCEKLELPLDQFMGLAIEAMRSISDELGF